MRLTTDTRSKGERPLAGCTQSTFASSNLIVRVTADKIQASMLHHRSRDGDAVRALFLFLVGHDEPDI